MGACTHARSSPVFACTAAGCACGRVVLDRAVQRTRTHRGLARVHRPDVLQGEHRTALARTLRLQRDDAHVARPRHRIGKLLSSELRAVAGPDRERRRHRDRVVAALGVAASGSRHCVPRWRRDRHVGRGHRDLSVAVRRSAFWRARAVRPDVAARPQDRGCIWPAHSGGHAGAAAPDPLPRRGEEHRRSGNGGAAAPRRRARARSPGALALGTTREAEDHARRNGQRAARLRAVKDDIAAMLDQEGLSLATLAARYRCTPRSIQRLFEAEGTTFSEYLLMQRLDRARRLLTDPRNADQKISSVAFDAGFGDLSYFHRSFRRNYGESPAEVREAARRYDA